MKMIRPRITSAVFRWLYIAAALLHLWAVAREEQGLIYASKPLLLTFLSLYFFFATHARRGRFQYFMLAGLIFSIGGDTLLMFSQGPAPDGQHFFTLGLGSFLITHIFYILAFRNWEKRGAVYRHPWLALPFLIYFFAISRYLWPDLPAGLQIPVLVYSAVITIMVISCLNIRDTLPWGLFRTLFAGVLLFLISDSFIALDVFKGDQLVLPYPRLIIMFTYLLGQYLIADSAIKMSFLHASQAAA